MGAQTNYGRVFSLCPHGVECVTVLEHGCAHQPSSSLSAVVEGFLWRLQCAGTIGYELNPKFQACNHGLIFGVTSPPSAGIQEPTKSPLISW